MAIYEERMSLPVGKGIELEVHRYYQEQGCPDIVLAGGLGVSAGRNLLVDDLSKNYCVTTFSPRGSGGSGGALTTEASTSDIRLIFDDLEQKRSRKTFGAWGYSLGGYSLARVLGEKSVAQKSVLLCPLLSMDEQNPSFISHPVKWAVHNPLSAKFLDACLDAYLPSGRNFKIVGAQGFRKEDLVPFVRSTFDAPKCDKPLLSDTKVILTGGTVFCQRIPYIDSLAKKWENLGAKVSVKEGINHCISGGVYNPSRHFYSVGESSGIHREILDFFE